MATNPNISPGGNGLHNLGPAVLLTDATNAADVNLAVRPHVVGVVNYTVGSTKAGLGENADGIDLNTPGMIALLSLDGIGNGPWVVQAGTWTRPPWFATGSHAAGAFVYVDGGSAEAHQVWVCTTAFGSDVVDTNSTAWVRASSGVPTTYGDASHSVSFRFSPEGRFTFATSVAIAIDGTAIATGTLPTGRMPGLTGDVNSLAGSTTTTVVNVAFAVVQTALAAATGDVSVNGHKLTNGATPTNPTDFAIKSYVDARALGISVKPPALTLATSAVGTLSGLSTTVSGVALNTDGQRVVLTAEASAVNNGLWVVHAGAWTRPTDFAAGSAAAAAFVLITAGTFAGTTWACTAVTGSDVVGTDNLPFAEFAVPGTISASDSTITVVGTAIARAAVTGDVAIPTGSNTATLAASGVTATTYGDASHVPQTTFDAKGRATMVTLVSIVIDAAGVASGNLANARLPVATTTAILFGRAAGGYDSDGLFSIDSTNHRMGVGTASPGFTLEVLGMSRLGGAVGINANPNTEAFAYLQTQITGDRDRQHHRIGGAGTALATTASPVSYVDWDASSTFIAPGATIPSIATHTFHAQTFSSSSATITDNAPATVVIKGPPGFVGGMAVPSTPRSLRIEAGDIAVDSGSVFAFQFVAGLNSISSSSIDLHVPGASSSSWAVAGFLSGGGGTIAVDSNLLAFWGGGGFASKPTVSGSRSGGAALTNLLAVLATYNLIINGTTT